MIQSRIQAESLVASLCAKGIQASIMSTASPEFSIASRILSVQFRHSKKQTSVANSSAFALARGKTAQARGGGLRRVRVHFVNLMNGEESQAQVIFFIIYIYLSINEREHYQGANE